MSDTSARASRFQLSEKCCLKTITFKIIECFDELR
jgi:hypothetical protein